MRGSDQSMAPGPEPPAWMLLDQEADVVNHDCWNPTTAEADAGFGRHVKVSFVAADPPRVSHLRVHCPGLTKVSDFRGTPSVLQSAANVALIRVRFRRSPKKEYFLYRAAGPRRRPALQHLKGVGDYLSRLPTLASVGFLPRGDGDGDDDGFVLAALVLASGPGRVQLHVFRSEKSSWTSHMLQVGRDGANHRPAIVERVMALGGGALAFVDLWKGILVLDALLEEEPKYRFIPMPKLLAGNQPDDFRGELSSARLFRDVALFSDGRIRCVEVEGITRRMINGKPAEEVVAASSGETPDDDLWNMDVLHDHHLLALSAAADTEEVKETYLYVGWRVIAWSRTLSCACWHKDFSFNADEISQSFALKDDQLVSARACAPTLGMDGKTLYLISRTSRDQEHVIGVDTRKKTLKEISPLLTRRPTFYKLNYMACDLSKYLNTDATQVAQHVASLSVSSAPREPIYFPCAQIHNTSHGNCQQQDPPTVGPPSGLQPPSPVLSAYVSQHVQPCSISGDRYPPLPPPPPILGTLSQQPPPLPSAFEVRKSTKIHNTLSQQPPPLPSALQPPTPPPLPINYPLQPIYFPRAQIHNTSNSYVNGQQQDPPAVAPPLRQQPPSPVPSAFVSQHVQPCSISGDRYPPPPPPILGTLSQQPPPPLPSNLQPWVRCLHVDYNVSCYYDLSGYGSYQQQHPEVGPIYLPPPPPPSPRPFSSTLQTPQNDGFHGNDQQQHPPVVGPLCLLPPLQPLLSLSDIQQLQQQQPPYPM
ncbi:hypothetical protein ACP70R_006550 [Stipagrostis hirtigluma subsp. patula]